MIILSTRTYRRERLGNSFAAWRLSSLLCFKVTKRRVNGGGRTIFPSGVQFLLPSTIYGRFECHGAGHIVVPGFDEQCIARKEFAGVAARPRVPRMHHPYRRYLFPNPQPCLPFPCQPPSVSLPFSLFTSAPNIAAYVAARTCRILIYYPAFSPYQPLYLYLTFSPPRGSLVEA